MRVIDPNQSFKQRVGAISARNLTNVAHSSQYLRLRALIGPTTLQKLRLEIGLQNNFIHVS